MHMVYAITHIYSIPYSQIVLNALVIGSTANISHRITWKNPSIQFNTSINLTYEWYDILLRWMVTNRIWVRSLETNVTTAMQETKLSLQILKGKNATENSQHTFPQVTGSDSTNFCSEVNNTINRPDKFIIYSISPLIYLPETELY